jgi:prevent-host-death family protein
MTMKAAATTTPPGSEQASGVGPVWSIADAKARFSRLLADARDAPQVIARRGERVAVVVDPGAFGELVREAAAVSPTARWKAFLRLSAEIRAAGGAELALARRVSRPSPFRGRGGS